jgi:hypothetical protein
MSTVRSLEQDSSVHTRASRPVVLGPPAVGALAVAGREVAPQVQGGSCGCHSSLCARALTLCQPPQPRAGTA